MAWERWAQLASDERSEMFLAALRDRLQRQSVVPPLPAGWRSESAMVPAAGFEYGGDFFVADVANGGTLLQMVLVDVCGHGPASVPDAVQFAGSLGALVLAVPPDDVMPAANAYLLSRSHPDSLTTAVQVLVGLDSGAYRIRSAGHPPVLRWDSTTQAWVGDTARGTALGVTADPAMVESEGVLAPGEALMFYTDGVVEARDSDIDAGIARLQQIARAAVAGGFVGAPARILAEVPRGEDDRAVLILHREATTPPDGPLSGSPA